MKVYLIRHAQSEENALDLATPMEIAVYNDLMRRSHVSPLTPLGERQAEQAAAALAGRPVDRLYSSPFTRALATASIIGAGLGLTPQVMDELREVLPRPLNERRGTRTLRRHFLRSYIGMLWPAGDDETWARGYGRARAAWAEITRAPAREVVAVAHRGLIGLILLSLRNSRRWRVAQRDLSNCGMSIVLSRE